MIRALGRLMLSYPVAGILSCLRTTGLTAAWTLFLLFVTACPGMKFAAWAGPGESLPEALPVEAAEGKPMPPSPVPPREESIPAASSLQEERLHTAPSVSSKPLTGPTGTDPSVPAPPASSAEGGGIVDVVHGGISQGFLNTAMWLDSFFGDERYEAEVNRSQFKVRFDAFRDGNTGVDYQRPNFDLRLVLPQLRHKTRLVISGDPTVDIDAASPQPGSPTASQAAKVPDRTVTTALQFVPLETKRSNFSIRTGLKLHKGKLELMVGPRYRYLVHYGPWDARFTEEELWTSDAGFQSRTRFDLERSFSNGLFFRTSLEGIWTEEVHGFPYFLIFLLRQPLDGNRALQYEWVNSFQTWPTDLLTEELFVFRYRQRFWRDWLFLELAPQVRFPRDRGFAYTPGILLRLEMVFGNIKNIF